MAHLVNRLTDRQVRGMVVPGRYPDGDGLYLCVSDGRRNGSLNRSWVLRVRVRSLDGDDRLVARTREMGLGSLEHTSLSAAREKAREARRIAQDGGDPVTSKAESIRQILLAEKRAAAEAARAMTFKQCAEAFIAMQGVTWRNAKHSSQWTATLERYVLPIFGSVSVAEIDVGMVTKALVPIWTTKAETARRVRGRIESILDWATVRGHRQGDNPARWRGHLEMALPARTRLSGPRRHAALPIDEMPEFMIRLRAAVGAGARALEFAILTAARTGEVLGATWPEFDLQRAVWTIPADRMKAGKEHRVPLSTGAIALLSAANASSAHAGEGFVFRAPKDRGALSNMAMLMSLRRLGREDLTSHGFRSTFRDWTAERTSFSSEVAEGALAHTIANKVEAAYRRGDLFDKRRALMQTWSDYCDGDRADVVQLKRTVSNQIE